MPEEELPAEPGGAIERALREDEEALTRRYPALAKSTRLAEVAQLRGREIKLPVRVSPGVEELGKQ